MNSSENIRVIAIGLPRRLILKSSVCGMLEVNALIGLL